MLKKKKKKKKKKKNRINERNWNFSDIKKKKKKKKIVINFAFHSLISQVPHLLKISVVFSVLFYLSSFKKKIQFL